MALRNIILGINDVIAHTTNFEKVGRGKIFFEEPEGNRGMTMLFLLKYYSGKLLTFFALSEQYYLII